MLLAIFIAVISVVIAVVLLSSVKRRSMPQLGAKQSVAFVHPDLGIGGAERLVVDAAVGLQNIGHAIVIYTSHHDPKHCFEETRNGQLKVKVFGDFFPRSIFGRFHILFATIRGLYLAIVILLTQPRFDTLIVDQLSAPMPILRLTGSRLVFYCHFPDLALTGRRGGLKQLYRIVFDWLEEVTTLMADEILVNSKFTASVFKSTFRSAKGRDPRVVYPSINLKSYDPDPATFRSLELYEGLQRHRTFVSINRFERKKNIALALQAFGLLKDKMGQEEKVAFQDLRMIVAGGYDPRVRENVEYMQELTDLAARLGVEKQVSFLPSFTEAQRGALLAGAAAVIYTPENEHFGIVPVEAMYSRRPLVACNSGGPLESVLPGETGFLCEPTAEAFAEGMRSVLRLGPAGAEAMGEAGRRRVQSLFSLEAFTTALDAALRRSS